MVRPREVVKEVSIKICLLALAVERIKISDQYVDLDGGFIMNN